MHTAASDMSLDLHQGSIYIYIYSTRDAHICGDHFAVLLVCNVLGIQTVIFSAGIYGYSVVSAQRGNHSNLSSLTRMEVLSGYRGMLSAIMKIEQGCSLHSLITCVAKPGHCSAWRYDCDR